MLPLQLLAQHLQAVRVFQTVFHETEFYSAAGNVDGLLCTAACPSPRLPERDRELLCFPSNPLAQPLIHQTNQTKALKPKMTLKSKAACFVFQLDMTGITQSPYNLNYLIFTTRYQWSYTSLLVEQDLEAIFPNKLSQISAMSRVTAWIQLKATK